MCPEVIKQVVQSRFYNLVFMLHENEIKTLLWNFSHASSFSCIKFASLSLLIKP